MKALTSDTRDRGTEKIPRTTFLSGRTGGRILTKIELWNKLTKEAKEEWYVGPYQEIPFEYYVQSPIGLVPKAGGDTRQIFHLSYDFGTEERQKSVNYHTPVHLCSVKYNDLDTAVRECLKLIKQENNCKLWFGLSDLKSAF